MKSSTQLIPWNTSDIICAYLLDSKGRNLPSKQGFASGVRGPKYFTIDIKKKYWAFKEKKYYADRRKLMVICARRLTVNISVSMSRKTKMFWSKNCVNVGTVTHPEVCDTVRSESWDWRESIMSLCVDPDKGALGSVLFEMTAKGLISCGMSPGSSLTSVMRILSINKSGIIWVKFISISITKSSIMTQQHIQESMHEY